MSTPSNVLEVHTHGIDIRGSHTFSDFSENEKVGREKGSQWGVPAHGGCVTPRFVVASMENENWRMGLP